MERLEEGRQRGSLAALAVVCRQLSPMALDVLWKNMNSVLPLFLCMPQDLWNWEDHWLPNHYSVRQLVLTRPIHPSDWDRVLFYAPRIRSLQPRTPGARSTDPRTIIHHDSIPTLLASLPSLQLLSNLRHVALYTSRMFCGVPSLMRFLPGRKVEHVHLECVCSTLDLSFLMASGRTIRRLDIVKGSARCTFDVLKPQLFHALTFMDHLEMLSIPSLDSRTLEIVSNLESLQELDLHALSESDPGLLSFLESHPGRLVFRSLQRLRISSANMSLVLPLLRSFRTSLKLQELSIVILTPHTSTEWQTLLDLLPNVCDNQTLQTLLLAEPISRHFIPDEEALESISDVPFNSILAFPSLAHLTIAVFSLRPLDGTLMSMASTWNTSLRSLSMSPHALKGDGRDSFHLGPILGIGLPNIWHDGVCTLKCLIPFGKCCPNLEHLDLGVEVSTDATNTIVEVPDLLDFNDDQVPGFDLEETPSPPIIHQSYHHQRQQQHRTTTTGPSPSHELTLRSPSIPGEEIASSSVAGHHTALDLFLDIRFTSEVQSTIAEFISSIFHNVIEMPFQSKLLDSIQRNYCVESRRKSASSAIDGAQALVRIDGGIKGRS
jgi:hypothetical protein